MPLIRSQPAHTTSAKPHTHTVYRTSMSYSKYQLCIKSAAKPRLTHIPSSVMHARWRFYVIHGGIIPNAEESWYRVLYHHSGIDATCARCIVGKMCIHSCKYKQARKNHASPLEGSIQANALRRYPIRS